MKFLIIGDLHGNLPNIYYKGFDAIIVPGDFCSDSLRTYIFKAIRQRIETNTKVDWYELMPEEKAKQMIQQSMNDGRLVLEYLIQ